MSRERKSGTFTSGEIESTWWWRRLVFCHFDLTTFTTARARNLKSIHAPDGLDDAFSLEFRLWEEQTEIAAWQYELVRRLRPEKKLPSWIGLPICAHSVLQRAIGQNLSKSLCAIFHPIRNEREWSKPMPLFQWNLEAGNSDLVRTFLSWIDGERRRNGLPESLFSERSKSGKRKSQNKGNRNRKVSWRWPELIGLHRWGGRSLSHNERSAKSNAEQEAREWEPAVLRALEMLKSPTFASLPEWWKPNTSFTRWLRENFERTYPLKAQESLLK